MAKHYVTFSEAVHTSLAQASSTTLTEMISIDHALGRVFAKDIRAVKNLPSFNNSAMDGFAVKAGDAGKRLKVNDVVYAGAVQSASLAEGECYKIMTGAQVPADVDTVVPVENVLRYEKGEVTLPETLHEGYAVRLKGEEVQEGGVLFHAGEEISARTVAVLASQGIVSMEVYKKLSIAVVSTGNELKEPWEKANENEIYNCNSYGIIATLKSKGFDASYIKVIPDNLEETVSFVSALKTYDIIITSGGISMGDADFVGRAFERNGLETLFDGINIKPGKPIMMGKMNHTFVICLPGNPLTALVNLYLFALPVIRKVQGHKCFHHNIEYAKNSTDFKTRSGRVNLVLGTLQGGEFTATRTNKYGAGMITVIEESNALVLTANETDKCLAETFVKTIRLDGDYIAEALQLLN